MSIGEKIRLLRMEKNLTQEQLAAAFDISISAVSQWESGRTTPDISMVVPLADFFGVSLDELFGYRSEKQTEEVNEYGRRAIACIEKQDFESGILLWREALRKYPGNFTCCYCLASMLLYSIDPAKSAEENNKRAQEIIALCEKLLRDCPDIRTKENAVKTLVSVYSHPLLAIADEEKAVEYAHMAVSSSSLLEHAYFTEENRPKAIRQRQQNILHQIGHITRSLRLITLKESPEEQIRACRAGLTMWETLIDDGNYLAYHRDIADLWWNIACANASMQKREETLDALRQVLWHLRLYDALPAGDHCFSCSFLREAKVHVPDFASRNLVQLYTNRLRYAVFDFLRDDAAFSGIAASSESEGDIQ
ncbi:MAG: helix-turn-helix transcriptional regulator [Lentisphaeria bacterium]|nr:helix-turn-helix transcriptional regulator [Lentisphaeria bacterium]